MLPVQVHVVMLVTHFVPFRRVIVEIIAMIVPRVCIRCSRPRYLSKVYVGIVHDNIREILAETNQLML